MILDLRGYYANYKERFPGIVETLNETFPFHLLMETHRCDSGWLDYIQDRLGKMAKWRYCRGERHPEEIRLERDSTWSLVSVGPIVKHDYIVYFKDPNDAVDFKLRYG